MEPDSQDELNAILRNLEALNSKIDSINNRLRALEEPFTDVDTANVAPDFIRDNVAFADVETMPTVPDFMKEQIPFTEVETVHGGPGFEEDTAALIINEPPPVAPVGKIIPLPPTAFPSLASALEKATASADVETAKTSRPESQRYDEAVAEFYPHNVAPKKPKETLEVRIATYWLLRIGLLFLALACVMLAREYARGPLGKVLSIYGVSIGLIIAGFWKEKKYPNWAGPVLAGGLAFSYFASYAIGFVEPMRLLDNLGVKLVILAANLALIFGVAHWKKSEVIGGTALVLGYLTTGVVGNDQAAFSSALALSLAALLFLWLNQWFISTALACAATYLSHFYVWQALPEAVERTPTEAFWYHMAFLSLYFIVFAAAGLAGRVSALKAGSRSPSNKPSKITRPDLLAVLAQTNVGGYIAGMVIVLRMTQVYWDKAWLFFFPTAILCALIALMFRGLKAAQTMYLIGAAFCLSLGILSLSSPKWLPVFLTLQGLVMLWRAKGQFASLWRLLSLLVLAYGAGYLLTGGNLDAMNLGKNHSHSFPWWTYAAVCLVMLGYAIRWEKTDVAVAGIPVNPIHFIVVAGAAYSWFSIYKIMPFQKDVVVYFAAAVPVTTFLAVIFKARGPILMACAMAALSLFNIDGLDQIGSIPDWHVQAIIISALLGCLSALFCEKSGTGNSFASRFLWQVVYAWSAVLLGLGVIWAFNGPACYVIEAGVFAAFIWVAWTFHSSAMAKAAYLIVPFTLGLIIERSATTIEAVVTILLLLVAAYPVALPRWRYRTGDRAPGFNKAGQAAVLLIAGSLFYWMGVYLNHWNQVFTIGLWAVFCSVYAALGRFSTVVWVVLFSGFFAAIAILDRIGFAESHFVGSDDNLVAASAAWTLAGVMLFVVAERILCRSERFALAGANGVKEWRGTRNIYGAQAALAIGSLVMAVGALRLLPEMRLFYFTGAMVAAAFLWIVFGFLFGEPVYRKSGFFLLCFGILKGLIWDVLSLKETFYRIVSWTILGLLTMAASFLYTKFKSRLDSGEVQ